MRVARDQVIPPVSAAETERLRDLLGGKRIDASFADGARLRGRVKEVRDGLLTVNVNRSAGPHAAPRGLQEIPTERLSAVRFTRYRGHKRALLGIVFSLGGIGIGGAAATMIYGDRSRGSYSTVAIIAAGMGALGYLWGRKKDKQNVILMIERQEAPGGL